MTCLFLPWIFCSGVRGHKIKCGHYAKFAHIEPYLGSVWYLYFCFNLEQKKNQVLDFQERFSSSCYLMGHCEIAVMFWALQIRVQNMLLAYFSRHFSSTMKTPSLFPKFIWLPPGGQEYKKEMYWKWSSSRKCWGVWFGESKTPL